MPAPPAPRRPTALAALTADAKTRTVLDRLSMSSGRRKPTGRTFNSAV